MAAAAKKNVVRIKVCARDTNTCVYVYVCVYVCVLYVCLRIGSLNLLHRQKVNGMPQQESSESGRAQGETEPESRLIYYVCMYVCVHVQPVCGIENRKANAKLG